METSCAEDYDSAQRSSGRPRQSLHEHQAIFAAVAANNPLEAERRMVAHLDAVREWAAGLPCWCGACPAAAD